MRSIGLIKEYLIAVGVDEQDAKSIVSPLHLLREHRNKLSAYVTQDSGGKLQGDAISKFGTYRRHYTYIVEKCLATFQHLDGIFVHASKVDPLDCTDLRHEPDNALMAKKQTANKATQQYEYDVALSVAGPDREYAEGLKDALVAKGIRVFYDRSFEADIWGKDLAPTLFQVFNKKARYCVVFVSREYKKRVWAAYEFNSALAREVEGVSEYILPIRIDDTELDGLSPSISYLSVDLGVERIAEALSEKLGHTDRLE